MRTVLRFFGLVLVLAALGLNLAAPAALAHKQLSAAGYTIELGFHQEPALQNTLNGLDVFVTDPKTGKGVTGLSDTLKAEIVFGSHKRLLPLLPLEGQDGAYSGAVVPTEAGNYTFHVYGTIQGKPVDVSATSGPGSFDPVQPVSAFAFPGTGGSSAVNLEPQVAVLHDKVDSANSAATTARWVAAAGVVLGLVGIAIGVVALRGRRAA